MALEENCTSRIPLENESDAESLYRDFRTNPFFSSEDKDDPDFVMLSEDEGESSTDDDYSDEEEICAPVEDVKVPCNKKHQSKAKSSQRYISFDTWIRKTSPFVWISIGIGLSLGFSMYLFSKDQQVFIKGLEIMQREFKDQHIHLWKLAAAAFLDHYAGKDNFQAAVFFIAHSKNNSDVAQCISTKLALLYAHSSTEKMKFIDGGLYSLPGSKLAIVNDVKVAFINNGVSSLVVSNFHKIDPASTLAFHGLCDSFDYANKAIIFTMEVSDKTFTTAKNSHSNWEMVINEEIGSLLKMKRERLDALLSRITPLVGLVTTGTNPCL